MSEKKPSRQKQPLHWIVEDLFNIAKARGLSMKDLSRIVKERTGTYVPEGSLKYWAYGYSSPRIEEVDAIATTLGYELDLLVREERKARSA